MKSAICLLLLMSLSGTHNAALAAEDLQGNTVGSIRNDGGDEIILQGFHWNSIRGPGQSWYSILAAKAATIAEDGFTAIATDLRSGTIAADYVAKQPGDGATLLTVGRELIADVETLAGPERADGISQRLARLLPQELVENVI